MTTAHEALIEKVALGLANAERGGNASFHLKWLDHGLSNDVYRFRARTAITLVYAEMQTVTPGQLQTAWRTFRGDRQGQLLPGAGPAFKEAILAAISTSPLNPRGE